MKYKSIPGINIQWPWTDLLLCGKKTIETRNYSLPTRFQNQELAIIQTPGNAGKKNGVKEAMIVGTIVFQKSFRYPTLTAWRNDFNRHLVKEGDPKFTFQKTKPKWGWEVVKVTKFKRSLPAPRSKGILYTKECKVPESLNDK